jgi:hypothetical protein
MVTDQYEDLKFTLSAGTAKSPMTLSLIQDINSPVIRNTGIVYNTFFGTVDALTGTFQKGNVSVSATYFPNNVQVQSLTKDMVVSINEIMKSDPGVNEQLNLSFDIHFNLVSIHPFLTAMDALQDC